MLSRIGRSRIGRSRMGQSRKMAKEVGMRLTQKIKA